MQIRKLNISQNKVIWITRNTFHEQYNQIEINCDHLTGKTIYLHEATLSLKILNPLTSTNPKWSPLTKILIQFLEGIIKKISQERRAFNLNNYFNTKRQLDTSRKS